MAPEDATSPPAPGPDADPTVVSAAAREVVEHLETLQRAPGSPGEAEAAEWFAARLSAAGAEVAVESASFQDGYARPLGRLSALAITAGLLGLSGRRRRLPALLAGASALAIADDVSNNLRFMRALSARRPTQNVVARLGEADAPRTLIVLGHHDAAPTGAIFNDDAQAWAVRRFPGLLERVDTGLPMWWLVLAGPLLTALGALTHRRWARRLGLLGSALDGAAFANIAASPTVPGANDNLSALAVQLGLVERLVAAPVPGLALMVVSCGAEEVIQGGIYSFCERHLPGLDPQRTWVLNLDTVGSPELVLLEGEGAVLMEDYCHRPFRDLVARVAQDAGAPLRRGLRARTSTDAVIPSRAGFPTATLVSIDRNKALSNYHQMSDTAANLCWRTIAQAILVCEEVARELATNPWLS